MSSGDSLRGVHIYPRKSVKPPFTLPVPGVDPVEGETIPRRHKKSINALATVPEAGINTLYDLIVNSARKYGDANALGSRKIIDTHVETKKIKKIVDGREEYVSKEWKYFELSGYSYMSYKEYLKLALELGSGLRKLGLQPKTDKVHIYAATSAHWLAIAHGAASQSIPIVTAYDTLGEEGLTHSLQATKAKLMFLDPSLLKTLINPLRKAKDLQVIVYNTDSEVSQDDIAKLKEAHGHLQIISFEELRDMGEDFPAAPTPPTSDDLCCVMYTSGSTGTPKGVAIKHRAIVGAVTGASDVIHRAFGPDDSYQTYLPLAHIIEFVMENCCLYWGAVMGYGTPKTLTDASVRNCKGDLREFKPTILAGVPAVWESVRKGVVAKVAAGGPLLNAAFWGAFYAKEFLITNNLPGSSILDQLIFAKVKEATGGKLRLCLSGGGPIARETQRFISMVVSTIINGYGLTETTSMTALCDPLEWTLDAIGGLPTTVEIKLVDFADAGYFAKNNQGEVWVRGPTVLDSYYENPVETQNAITSDGWFKTGDIGEWDANYHLKVIDRKKNMVKTLNGEYIAIEKLESIYRSAPVVANICVYAAPDRAKPIAIIVPVELALKTLAASNKIDGDNLETLIHIKALQALVLRQLQATGKAAGLVGIELLDGVVIADEEWTPQNQFVTPAQKLNRKLVLDRYKKQIAEVFANNSS